MILGFVDTHVKDTTPAQLIVGVLLKPTHRYFFSDCFQKSSYCYIFFDDRAANIKKSISRVVISWTARAQNSIASAQSHLGRHYPHFLAEKKTIVSLGTEQMQGIMFSPALVHVLWVKAQ